MNVGCIPKKLMHQSALIGETIKDSVHFGWKIPEKPNTDKSQNTSTTPNEEQPPTIKIPKIDHDWQTLVNNVNGHVKQLNWGYLSALIKKEVKYLNAQGQFLDNNTIQCTDKKGTKVRQLWCVLRVIFLFYFIFLIFF